MRLLNLITLLTIIALFFACGNNENKENNDTNKNTENQKPKEEPRPKINEELTALSQIMAGAEVTYKTPLTDSITKSVQGKQHFKEFNDGFNKLDKERLSKMREWSKTELSDFNAGGKTLFYPFSGPDILIAYEFFPNCDNYLMFGLEKDGNLPNLNKLPNNYLGGLRTALRDLFTRGYFITSHMGGLWGQGVLPFLNIFLVRTGNEIIDAKRFYVDESGKPVLMNLEDPNAKIDPKAPKDNRVKGVMVEFLNKNRKKSQKVYYIGGDVSDRAMKGNNSVVKFIQGFSDKVTFIKSASYILHNSDFAVFRNLILNETSAVLQDDTGVRYSVYQENGWSVKMYGNYDFPVADFGRYTYQSDVAKIYKEDKSIPKLNFTYGYHWKTDKSSVFVARKGNGEKQVAKDEKETPKKDEKETTKGDKVKEKK
ncbi:MAG: hypothetical protein EAZ44_01645 [Cytophagia bacterium]|nr:MAG: hypothetical protein EAZ44_01645 [Cytophagia bacterium]TAG44315.1 MAG: hypothetical protein EAZ31_02525 [Cytophagia bacterium]